MSAFDPSKKVRSMAVLIAMDSEAKHIYESMELSERAITTPNAPCVFHGGNFHGCDVTIVNFGNCKKFGVDNVGTTPAAIATFIAINELKPDILINAGTAGGFKRAGATIGDPFIATKFMHHDRRIPIPGFTEYGKGDHPALAVEKMIKDLGFKKGILTTGNSLDHTEMDDKIMLENDASIKDMEGAAIAWVAELSSTPLVSLKVVTDIVDGDRPTQEEFFENLGAAAKSLNANVPKIIEYAAGKTLGELNE